MTSTIEAEVKESDFFPIEEDNLETPRSYNWFHWETGLKAYIRNKFISLQEQVYHLIAH